MYCIRCGSTQSHVLYTRRNTVQDIILRKRECLHCDATWTTEERLKEKKAIHENNSRMST